MKAYLKPAITALLVTGFGLVNLTISTPARAVTLVGTTAAATGVDGLLVGTTLYDVTFDLGTADALFPSNPPIFNNVTDANSAASALLTTLNALDVTGLTPQENPYEINVPYSTVSGGNYSAVEFSYDVWTPNQWGENSGYQNVSLPGDYDYGHNFIAEFSVTPLPAALPLFAAGLGAMGLFGWRRRRKAASLAAV